MRISDWSSDVCSSGLFGGASIKVENALFDAEASGLAIISDLFGDDRYFADSDGFWKQQNVVIEERREAYLDEGWSDVVIVAPGEYFPRYEFVRAPQRKGGRVYIDVAANGEVALYDGYVTSKEATGRKSVVAGKSESGRVTVGGASVLKKHIKVKKKEITDN